MNTSYSISESLSTQAENVNKSLNSRWIYYKSIGGALLIACYACDPLYFEPHYIEIDRIEYEHLCKEMNS